MVGLAVGLAIAVAVIYRAALKTALFDRNPIHIQKVERTRLAAGLELVEAELARGDASGGRIVALYFDPKVVTPYIALNDEQRPIEEVEPDAIAVMNAGFFTRERRPTGLLVSEGRLLSPFVPNAGGAGSGVFAIQDGTASLWARDRVAKRSFDGAALAIQAGPRIIEPSGADGIRSDDGARASRSVIGMTADGRTSICVVLGASGWASGPTLYEVQHLLGSRGLGRKAPDLAFRAALNLDGGPSTGIHIRASGRQIDAPESAPVHSVLALRLPR